MMKKLKIPLALMVSFTVVYACAVAYVVYVNAYSGECSEYEWCGASVYESEPAVWYTPEQLGIVQVFEYELDDGSVWLNTKAVPENLPFWLTEEQPIFLYDGEFYQISRGGFPIYSTHKYVSETAPAVWYAPEQLAIVQFGGESGDMYVWCEIDPVRQPNVEDGTIVLYDGVFYEFLPVHVDAFGPKQSLLPQPAFGVFGWMLGVGWILTGALFIKWRRKVSFDRSNHG
jgi:hypothetical protein